MNDQERDTLLSHMDEKLDDLLQWKSGFSEHCKAMCSKLLELYKTIYGNPGGLEMEVQKLVSCKTNISRWRDFLIFILRQVVTLGIIGVAIWLLKVYKAL